MDTLNVPSTPVTQTAIPAAIPADQIAIITQFDAYPAEFRVVGGEPSVPADLLAILPEPGQFKAAKVNWASFRAKIDQAKTDKNKGKAYCQCSVKVEIEGATGTLRFWRSELSELIAAAEGGKLLIARLEQANPNDSNRPYQSLVFKAAN